MTRRAELSIAYARDGYALLQAVARHNGHADLLRESVDGSTGYY